MRIAFAFAFAAAAASSLLLVGACGPQAALSKGEALFSSKELSPSPTNTLSCATCHETIPTGDGTKHLPGYTLHDTVVRPSWWGGSYTTLLDAVNECLVEFMRGDALSTDNEQGRALFVYLESISPDTKADALPLTIVKDITDVPKGDATRGKATYDAACSNCHGAIHTGEGRIGDYVSVIPDESIANHGTDPTTGARPITIEKVRHGKFFSIGGNMPPFSTEALSDAELGDILAYMGL